MADGSFAVATSSTTTLALLALVDNGGVRLSDDCAVVLDSRFVVFGTRLGIWVFVAVSAIDGCEGKDFVIFEVDGVTSSRPDSFGMSLLGTSSDVCEVIGDVAKTAGLLAVVLGVSTRSIDFGLAVFFGVVFRAFRRGGGLKWGIVGFVEATFGFSFSTTVSATCSLTVSDSLGVVACSSSIDDASLSLPRSSATADAWSAAATSPASAMAKAWRAPWRSE